MLVLLRAGEAGTQGELAAAMGLKPATLTHHIAALERRGLVRRWREPDNRRVQRAELTEAGIEQFDRLRAVAVAHDERLRVGLDTDEVAQLGALLDRLAANVRQP